MYVVIDHHRVFANSLSHTVKIEILQNKYWNAVLHPALQPQLSTLSTSLVQLMPQ